MAFFNNALAMIGQQASLTRKSEIPIAQPAGEPVTVPVE
jgi:hypothetical protein